MVNTAGRSVSRATKGTKAKSSAVQHAPTATAVARGVAKQKKQAAKGTRVGSDHNESVVKPASDKVIRDSFTMPVADYKLIGALKKRCIEFGVAIKKSELLRAGLAALQRLPDQHLTTIVASVHSVKTGRPPGKKKAKRAKHEKQ